ncbi:unnamed protein product, partial [Vitis vinifera]|uniref:Uncharacterized protein n=1 Tax=Vitis vinifera TaxID=29760 RepID=D7TAU4_VITVI
MQSCKVISGCYINNLVNYFKSFGRHKYRRNYQVQSQSDHISLLSLSKLIQDINYQVFGPKKKRIFFIPNLHSSNY